MRSTQLRIVLAGWLFAAGLPVAAAADPSLLVASGKVEVGKGTPPIWHVAQSGEALAPGDSVRTAAGARAELQLGDNRIVRVYESSVLRVGTSVTPTGAVRSVDLDEGQSIFDVMKKTVADEFDVVTPEIVVSVKGTRFLVAAAPGADYTSVFRGVVGLAGKGFEAVSVRPGMTGAQGELFLTPYADPWAAWETDASAPEPADRRRPPRAGRGGAGRGRRRRRRQRRLLGRRQRRQLEGSRWGRRSRRRPAGLRDRSRQRRSVGAGRRRRRWLGARRRHRGGR